MTQKGRRRSTVCVYSESEYSSAMSDEKIKDSYLESYDNSIINVSQTSSIDAKWENERT